MKIGKNGNKTCNIYEDLTKQVSVLIHNIIIEIDNEKAKETFNNVKVILENINNDVASEYNELKRNTEWENFTIAFYGETNAGKSTIIETLRIIWKETQKQKSIQRFKDIQAKYGLTQDRLMSINSQIEEVEKQIREKQEEINKFDSNTEEFISEKKEIIKQLGLDVLSKTPQRKQWKKAISNTVMDSKIRLEMMGLRKARIDKNVLKHEMIMEYLCLKKKLDDLKNAQEALLKQRAFLSGFEDGDIIGDGRADFTKVNTIYNFEIGNTLVDIIDVPGIEGNECTVVEEILNAVQRAHCVFYVTRKVTAPQTGDKKEGTIQKIKRHLGAQTEVWTIVNQSVKSPRRLGKDLISEGEIDSLKVLNKVMKEELGDEAYCGEIVLSAYVAFLAVSECLIPNSKTMIEKLNFTSKFTPERMLELSRFYDFEKLLAEEIIKNKKDKIYKSNYNKAMHVLEVVINKIDSIIENQIEPLRNDMKHTYESAVDNINLEERNIKSFFNKYHKNWLHSLITNCKKDLHNKINEGIDNEKIEELCKTVVEKNTALMQKTYEKDIKAEIKNFEKKISDIVKDTFKYYDKITALNKKMKFDLKYEFNFDFKSGFKPEELIWTAMGIIFTLVLSGGSLGVLAIIGIAVSLLGGLYRSLKSVFSDTYKKKQQKEAVDKFLKNVDSKIKEKLNKQNEKIRDKITESCNNVRESIKEPVKIINENKKCMEKALKEIKRLK